MALSTHGFVNFALPCYAHCLRLVFAPWAEITMNCVRFE